MSLKRESASIVNDHVRDDLLRDDHDVALFFLLNPFHSLLSEEGSTKKTTIFSNDKNVMRTDNWHEFLAFWNKTCSLGQITNALFEVGGQYRRNM